MKRIALFLAALSVSLTAAAQSWSSEWVPKHEFHIDVFGGLSALNYQVNSGFAPNATYPLFADRLGGGAGLGYTLHFNENWGLTLGAEAAIWRGSFSAANNPWIFYKVDGSDDPNLFALNICNEQDNGTPDDIVLKETQTLYSVQVPLMVQFMVPLNEAKSNHFYFAVGPRFLFNVAGNYNRTFTGFYTAPDVSASPGPISVDDQKWGRILWNYGGIPIDEIGNSNGTVFWGPTQVPLTADQVQEAINNRDPQVLQMLLGWDDGEWDDIAAPAEGSTAAGRSFPGLESKGKLNTNLFNVAASGELGFRWGLGNGWGLYTGLYLDYGFLSPLSKVNPADFITYNRERKNVSFAEQSLLEVRFDDVTMTTHAVSDPTAAGPAEEVSVTVDHRKLDVASKLSNLGAGLKLKLAFGKAAPAKKPEPQIIYVDRIVRDTVVKTNTVTVRDTVVKTNTVIEKEIQIVRDTVTIIKEVPVEIKQTMMELSNTMFDFDKSVIKDVAKGPLNKVVLWLQENPAVKVEISGHTDSKGSDSYNQRLSEARAKAVYEYFISQGVDKFRLAYAGYGESRPIASNDTEEGRQQNRRVELNIIQ